MTVALVILCVLLGASLVALAIVAGLYHARGRALTLARNQLAEMGLDVRRLMAERRIALLSDVELQREVEDALNRWLPVDDDRTPVDPLAGR